MKTPKKFYIKERHNPQIGVYYVLEGQLTKRDAKKKENPIYGDNVMLDYSTKEDYEAAIENLKSTGARIR